MLIYIVKYDHAFGTDITAYSTLKRAEEIAEDIRKEWHPSSATYQDIYDDSFGKESVQILESFLEGA